MKIYGYQYIFIAFIKHTFSHFLKLSSFEGFPLKVCFHHRSLATFPLFNASNPYLAPQINVIGMLFDSKLTFCTLKWPVLCKICFTAVF